MIVLLFYCSAYCGGLWLAALKMYTEICRIVGNTEEMNKYTEILDKGKAAFDTKLWNGKFNIGVNSISSI